MEFKKSGIKITSLTYCYNRISKYSLLAQISPKVKSIRRILDQAELQTMRWILKFSSTSGNFGKHQKHVEVYQINTMLESISNLAWLLYIMQHRFTQQGKLNVECSCDPNNLIHVTRLERELLANVTCNPLQSWLRDCESSDCVIDSWNLISRTQGYTKVAQNS